MANEGRVPVTITYTYPGEEQPTWYTRPLSLARLAALISVLDYLADDDDAASMALEVSDPYTRLHVRAISVADDARQITEEPTDGR